MWTNQINAAFFKKTIAQRQRVCRPIIYQPFDLSLRTSASTFTDAYGIQGRFNQFRFVRRRGSKLEPERYALTIRHHHKLRSFASLGFSNSGAPFFAGENVPSAKISSHLRRPCSSSVSSSLCQTSIQTSSSCHWFIRRQQVLPEGKRSGISFHRAPLRKIHKIPSRQARLDAGFCPPLRERVGSGSRGCNTCHCLSVSSLPVTYSRFFINNSPFGNREYITLQTNAIAIMKWKTGYEIASNNIVDIIVCES